VRVRHLFTSNMLAAHGEAKTATRAIRSMDKGSRLVIAGANTTVRLPSGKLIPFKDSRRYKMATFAWNKMNFEERVKAIKARKNILAFIKLRAELQRIP